MKKRHDWIFWTPRIVSIIFIIFLALFSLDVFGNDYGFWGTLVAFLMHNIPVFILAILLWISWKREIIGAWTFILAGLLYMGFVINSAITSGFQWYYLVWALQIAGPAFFIGILFWIGWKRRIKKR